MIEAINLTKHFSSFVAIEDVSFTVEKGEIVGLIGPNGAGKSTTMRILTCFSTPTMGTAVVAGFDVHEDPLEVRRRIGYFPEKAPLYTNLSVRSYLNFVAEVKGIARADRKKKIGKAMDHCGITHVSGRSIENLSKGYRQRVCLAQAILNDPQVLILDEPTIGLDPKQNFEVRKLIQDLAGDRTVILSTHILSEVSMICHRVLIINRGRLIAEDSIEGLMKKSQEHNRIIVKVKGPHEDVIKSLKTLSPSVSLIKKEETESSSISAYLMDIGEGIQEKVADTVIGNGWGLLEIRPKETSLEEVYISLITK
jgi:ABC-2 type transport system ATP-binding protein